MEEAGRRRNLEYLRAGSKLHPAHRRGNPHAVKKAVHLNSPAAHIRPATPADLPRILQIERAAETAAHWPPSDYEQALAGASPRRLLLLAEAVTLVQGFLVARSAHVSEWEIENVVVAVPARKLGLGTALLSAFLEHARADAPSAAQGLTIFLEVRESNFAARRLYEKAGFTIAGRREGYYNHPSESAVIYRLLFQ